MHTLSYGWVTQQNTCFNYKISRAYHIQNGFPPYSNVQRSGGFATSDQLHLAVCWHPSLHCLGVVSSHCAGAQDPKLRSAAKLFGLKWRAEWLKIFEHGMEDARPIWTDGWQHLRNQQRIKFDIEDIFHFSTCTDRCGCWILLWYNIYVHVANIRTYIDYV